MNENQKEIPESYRMEYRESEAFEALRYRIDFHLIREEPAQLAEPLKRTQFLQIFHLTKCRLKWNL